VTVPTPTITPASNYFRSVRRRQNPRVPLCSSCRELRPSAFDSSIRPTFCPQSANLCLTLANCVFSNEPPPLLNIGFLRFFVFPFVHGPFLPSLSPLAAAPHPRRSPPPRGGPQPPPAVARAPCHARAAGSAGSALPHARNPLLSPTPPWVERKEKEEEEEDGDFAI
jgi:hypothetical protein